MQDKTVKQRKQAGRWERMELIYRRRHREQHKESRTERDRERHTEKLVVVVASYNSSMQEAEAGGWRVGGQSGLLSRTVKQKEKEGRISNLKLNRWSP